VERFELYIAGLELCNGFSELIDGVEQRRRFEEERTLRKSAGRSVYPMPERFLEALACMPPATGNAMGLDRLAMLITNSSRIDEVVTFIPEEL
jgi:lysyl-tRNA synthetase class 2